MGVATAALAPLDRQLLLAYLSDAIAALSLEFCRLIGAIAALSILQGRFSGHVTLNHEKRGHPSLQGLAYGVKFRFHFFFIVLPLQDRDRDFHPLPVVLCLSLMPQMAGCHPTSFGTLLQRDSLVLHGTLLQRASLVLHGTY